jgi:manganese oxidase
MAIRHYVLIATDGFTKVPGRPNGLPPENNDLCTHDTDNIYIFGFTGGLFKVDNRIVNKKLNWQNQANWPYLRSLIGTATIPSPLIWGEVGDKIYITLINLGMKVRPDLADAHTVHLHGAHVPTQIDGFPEASFGVPMWHFNASHPTAPPVATYFFYPENPGTYMYHCHVKASEHVQMGMYGALVIYPSYKSLKKEGIRKRCGVWTLDGVPLKHIPSSATNRSFAYNDVQSYFDKEYVMLLSDIDSAWHEALRTGGDFNAVNFKPDLWLVNGRAFPYTLLPNPPRYPSGKIAKDPDITQLTYESYVHVKTEDKFLLRMINLGYQVVPWHIHGWHFTIIGKDARPSPFLNINAALSKLGYGSHKNLDMGFTVSIGSGETYDLLLTADDKRPIYKDYLTKGSKKANLPSLCSQMKTLQSQSMPGEPNPIADIPTEPVNCSNIKTVNYVDICKHTSKKNDNYFPQFYPMHNHDDYKVTNRGVYPGGQLTYIQTDAPED